MSCCVTFRFKGKLSKMLNFNPEFSQRTHGQIICISIIIYIFIKYEINKYNLMNQFMQPYLKLHVNTKK